MAYVATNWVDYPNVSTAITAAQLNRIEAGIVAVSDIVLNAKTYGVKFDGVTDDTAAWAAAITATQAVAGKLVAPVGAGTSIIASQLTVSAACELDLGGCTLKKKATFTASTAALKVTGNNVTVRNLTVDGNRSAGAAGYGIWWTGTGGRAENCTFSHNTQIGVFVSAGDLKCLNVAASDNVTGSQLGDGFYVGVGLLETDARCEANSNGRAGFVCESNAADLCVINGVAKLNGVSGFFLLSNRGRSQYMYAYDNTLYGVRFDNATDATKAQRWACAYIECVNQGKTAGEPTAAAVQLMGATLTSIGTIVCKGTPSYALAFAGGGTVGSTYNRVGVVVSDTSDAANANPGIIYSGGSVSGSTHNFVGSAYMKGHTVAVNFGESSNGGNDHNTIGFLHAEDCTYGCVWVGTGSYNRVQTVVSRNCYTTNASIPGLVSFINTTTTTDNVIGVLDHRTTSGTKPLYLVSFATGTSRNEVREIQAPGGDYQTNWVTDSAANSRYPAVIAAPLKPSAALYESIPRQTITGDIAALATAQMTMVAVTLPAGAKITTITLLSGATPLATGLNQWFALYDSALAKLAVTGDDTSTAWAANTVKTLTLAAPFTTTYEGLHYVAVLVKATTPPSLRGAAIDSSVIGLTPKLAGLSTSGLTNPASAPSTAGAITAFGAHPYCYVA